MKPDLQSRFDIDGLEAPLPELTRWRRTSRQEVPPETLKHRVRARLDATLARDRGSERKAVPARALLVAAVVLLVVPTAVAATGLGGALVQQVMELWPTSVEEHSALQERELGHVAGPRAASATNDEPPNASPSELAPVPELPSAVEPTASRPVLKGLSQQPSRPPAARALRESSSLPPATRPHSSAAWSASRPQLVTKESQQAGETSGGIPAAATGSGLPSSASSLQEERLVLERARLRLSAGDAAGVLALTADHERRFPRGLLVQERARLRARARALLEEANSENRTARDNME